MKAQYRVNWGNGQVQTVCSKAEGLRMIKGDLYEAFAFLQVRVGAEEWTKVKGDLS